MNSLQEKGAALVAQIAGDLGGRVVEPFSEVQGKREAYARALVERAQTAAEIFLYQNEVGFMLAGERWHPFERADYESNDLMLSAFAQSLREALSR